MKTYLLLLATIIFNSCSGVLTECPAAPLTPAQEQLVRGIDRLAKTAEAKADAATAAEATEHQEHLKAAAAAAQAQVQVTRLGAACAAAQADALKQKARGDALAREVRDLIFYLLIAGLMAGVGIYLAGAALQTVLQALVAAVFRVFLSGVSAIRLLLKTACPTLFFWL